MSEVQNGTLPKEESFDQFQKEFPKEIRIPADPSPSALLPPEDIILVRDPASKGVVYRAKMNIHFKPFEKEQNTNGNGNGNGSHNSDAKE